MTCDSKSSLNITQIEMGYLTSMTVSIAQVVTENIYNYTDNGLCAMVCDTDTSLIKILVQTCAVFTNTKEAHQAPHTHTHTIHMEKTYLCLSTLPFVYDCGNWNRLWWRNLRELVRCPTDQTSSQARPQRRDWFDR